MTATSPSSSHAGCPHACVAVVSLAPDGGRVRLTPERLTALVETVETLSAHPDTALLLLTGGPREFCTGADLDHLKACSPAQARHYLLLGRRLVHALADAPIPTLAAVGGLALGGGFELALACDLRWAHRKAAFALPEAGLGLVPAWGAAAALARELTAPRAWELLAGERIGAARAHEIGLIGRVFEGPDFATRVVEQARALAAPGRGTLAALKSVWRAATAGGGNAGMAEIDACLARLDAGREGRAVRQWSE